MRKDEAWRRMSLVHSELLCRSTVTTSCANFFRKSPFQSNRIGTIKINSIAETASIQEKSPISLIQSELSRTFPERQEKEP